MTYQVVVTCTRSPCPKCASRREGKYFVSPVAIGAHIARFAADKDAAVCASTSGRDGLHRYDVAELRPDGWPLCPWCGEDELYSLALHPSVDTICGCYRCGTTCPKKERTP